MGQQEEKAEEKSEAEGEGRQVTSSFDACFWGLLSFVVFSVVPAGLKSEVARVQERIHAALPSPLAGPPTPDFPDYPQQLDDGNRRLDLNVYNYVDPSGPSNDLADSSFSPGESPFSSDSQFSPGESPPPFSPRQTQGSHPTLSTSSSISLLTGLARPHHTASLHISNPPLGCNSSQSIQAKVKQAGLKEGLVLQYTLLQSPPPCCKMTGRAS